MKAKFSLIAAWCFLLVLGTWADEENNGVNADAIAGRENKNNGAQYPMGKALLDWIGACPY